MSAEERKQILQMVSDGKISAEEAAKLMRALDADPAAEQVILSEPSAEADAPEWRERPDAPEFELVRRRAKRFAMIPLWAGVAFTTLVAWWMYSTLQQHGLNFWFFCLTMPFLLGVALIALSAGSQSARWLYVNVDRSHQNEWPRHITLGFPLPLGLATWAIKNFGASWDFMEGKPVDQILEALSAAKNISEPVIVHVDERDEGGEHVQVFIG
ncbi:MAG: hypothetical protein Fur002_10250 [Anaerolineales bacterium]